MKLADFGFSCRYMLGKKKIPMKSDAMVGTLKTCAPEIINPSALKEVYADDLDLFAAGCVLFEMVMKCQPFKIASLEDEYYRKLMQDRNGFWKIFSMEHQCSSEFKGYYSLTQT